VCKLDRKEEVHCYSEIKAALRWSTSAAKPEWMLRHVAGFDLLVVLLGPVPCTALFIGVDCGDSLLRTHVLKIPASSAGWAVLSVGSAKYAKAL